MCAEDADWEMMGFCQGKDGFIGEGLTVVPGPPKGPKVCQP